MPPSLSLPTAALRTGFAAVLTCNAAIAQSATLVSDFSNELTGFDVDACGFTCGRPTDPFFDIADNGGDPYLAITTGTSLLGVTQASATMDIAINASANILSFDAVQFGTQNDPGSSGTGPFFDALSILVIDESSQFHFIFDLVASGPVFNPFSNTSISVTQTTASDPFFDTGVSADLSAFNGQTLSFGIYAFTESDSSILSGGFDNFELTGHDIPSVPVPASLAMLLSALGALGLQGRRTKTPPLT